jgi:hypothetical protein
MTMSVPPQRVGRIQEIIADILARPHRVQKREITSLAGVLQSAARVMRPTKPFVQRLYDAAKGNLDEFIELPREIVEDLSWWLVNITKFSSQPLRALPPILFLNEISRNTDASFTACAGVLGVKAWRHAWTEKERAWLIEHHGIAAAEAYAVLIHCIRNRELFAGHSVQLCCDNTNVVFALNNGSTRNRYLLAVIRKLAEIQLENNFVLSLVYVRSVDNVVADLFSRLDRSVQVEGCEVWAE